jgi:cbb3-type cytochrome oxidase maturation protein
VGLVVLIPIAIAMGVVAFLLFLWTVRAGQYEDMDGAAHRILDPTDKPITDRRDSPDPRARR